MDRLRIVWRNYERSVPVPTDLGVWLRRRDDVGSTPATTPAAATTPARASWADAGSFSVDEVAASNVAVLRLRVDDGEVGWVDGSVKAITAADPLPVLR